MNSIFIGDIQNPAHKESWTRACFYYEASLMLPPLAIISVIISVFGKLSEFHQLISSNSYSQPVIEVPIPVISSIFH